MSDKYVNYEKLIIIDKINKMVYFNTQKKTSNLFSRFSS